MTKKPPITVEYLEQEGPPLVTSPANGIVCVMSVDGSECVDMTPDQAVEVAHNLFQWAEIARRTEKNANH